ncbi:MAG: hypothetical protein HFH68_16065 [Lachnospiraceae bacterium]|nr:hypothetical protein [Lachnospiraceae bacterium]
MVKRTLVMGKYPQNCGLEKEPVEWIVLKENQGCCLCLSRYLLDYRPYHNCLEKVIWQDCTLRNWLNHEFLMTAFSDEEREKILLSDIANPAKNTQDYIFLLDYDEVEEYFDDEVEDYVSYDERGALTTAYVRNKGAWFVDEDCGEKNKGSWFLRYYGEKCPAREGKYDFISCVNFDGYIEQAAIDVSDMDGIRPAFWLKIV